MFFTTVAIYITNMDEKSKGWHSALTIDLNLLCHKY